MELYYKDLISKESSLEKLVDDLMLVVQGAHEFAEAAGVNLEPTRKEEIKRHLQRLKDRCQRVEKHAIATALATDKVLRQYPYSFAGFAFGFGILAGILLKRRKVSS